MGRLAIGQRIAVRWPGLMHVTTTSVLRLPTGSRLRRSLLGARRASRLRGLER